MKPILVTTWPIHIDYPLFRYNIKRFKQYFSGIWIALSNHHQEVDYTNFFMAQMPYAHFFSVKHSGVDWRNDAINETLDQIKTNEPICFIEQDFLIQDESFFEKVFKDEYPFIYFTEGERVHPAFAIVSREYIDKTSKDFSAYPDTFGDHFAKFFQELPTTGIYLEELGVKNKIDYFHINGLTQNYMNFKNESPFYNPEEFLAYNYLCFTLPIENHPQFLQVERNILIKYGNGKGENVEFMRSFFRHLSLLNKER